MEDYQYNRKRQMIMKRKIGILRNSIIITALFAMLLFFGCKKEEPCKSVIQGDFELVP